VEKKLDGPKESPKEKKTEPTNPTKHQCKSKETPAVHTGGKEHFKTRVSNGIRDGKKCKI
jgi:hypothetical protein